MPKNVVKDPGRQLLLQCSGLECTLVNHLTVVIFIAVFFSLCMSSIKLYMHGLVVMKDLQPKEQDLFLLFTRIWIRFTTSMLPEHDCIYPMSEPYLRLPHHRYNTFIFQSCLLKHYKDNLCLFKFSVLP